MKIFEAVLQQKIVITKPKTAASCFADVIFFPGNSLRACPDPTDNSHFRSSTCSIFGIPIKLYNHGGVIELYRINNEF